MPLRKVYKDMQYLLGLLVVKMENPKLYNNENSMQRRDAGDVLTHFLSKMFWKPNEIVLDVGCGPGDVTYEILYPFLQDKIEKLVCCK